ncbi:NADPH-dependent ferric siderophore reductase, contains FAD-binding and SIP domains [Nocardia amikacinitolerans]|uniref:NADPH-dependent ferric siderophore reductase, contains FAD-binding and SIP domains n=1 Tax=Nocardia amikacinitolerans TaxID=756689 RepID=A0A285LSK2_9NOCA|nr:siderophore-interacting protein [Nocardia amikacinitolerans]MCP2295669.1 NADPH-dependent ferric siderophore reductase, contains FAD-binding and SIP domains [Nocardia amikacinitolerans]SNY87889.1 NADPH-dependent ferric siderophore reductase, contains FAD-binding and SIP domains [Nocardia amikacinitolerans]
MGRGANGVILKVWRADDYRLRVTSTEAITDKYQRIGFTAGGLLADHPVHPTQFIRLWIPDAETDKLHHRGYTIVDQDPEGDHFYIEFAVHSGPASAWAQRAKVGDEIEASVLGSKFELPETAPSEYLMFGDTASLPAINSLLDAIGDAPARVWLEWQYESDQSLPVRNKPHHQVNWLQRVDDGRLLREQAQQISCPADAFAWVACDGHTTRSIVKTLKQTHDLPKSQLKYQAYWK